MIRAGTYDDLKGCVAVAKEFWNQLDFSEQIQFVEQDCEDMFVMCLQQGLVAVHEDDGKIIGVIAGLSSPCTANFQFRFGAELIWYVKEEYRKTGAGLRLLEQIEKQAREVGCVRWSTMVFDQHNPERGEGILKQQGYVPTERAFAKVLV